MSVLCRTVTWFRARRVTAPEVAPAATAPEVTPKATSPEVIIPTAQATEVMAEEHAATSEPAGTREEPPLVPAGDSTENFADHVSVLELLFCFSCIFIGCATALPIGVAPEATCDCLQSGVGSISSHVL